ncbi:MAG: glycosyltransferase family 4 protein [Gaiellaceae bacterium]
MPPTIGISLLTLVPGISGGSETYVRSLVQALARVGELDYRVFVPQVAPEAGDGLPSQLVRSYRASRTVPGRMAALSLAAALPRRLRRELELERLQAIHFPLTIMVPSIDRLPAAVTVLDVQHELHPGFFSRSELAYRKLAYGHAIRRSRVVITISESSKQALIAHLGLPDERVRVVYLAVDHHRFRPAGAEREPFILYPANRWPHKNHDRLFQALALLRRERPELRLLLTGAGHDATPLPEGVELKGWMRVEELVDLYRRAACLVFPSLYEGFGQPPLEAMACGCPVACSDIPVLREVCRDAARFFDPKSPEAIAEAVSELLDRPGDLLERGIERAASFTWERSAREHERIYAELVS